MPFLNGTGGIACDSYGNLYAQAGVSFDPNQFGKLLKNALSQKFGLTGSVTVAFTGDLTESGIIGMMTGAGGGIGGGDYGVNLGVLAPAHAGDPWVPYLGGGVPGIDLGFGGGYQLKGKTKNCP